MDSKTYYITTPIYYVNDVPHIGHTCTTVAADVLARYHRQINDKVFFLTGTDEHGQKIADEAKKAGISPQEFCDQIAPRFALAWDQLNISYDHFFRTTDPRHEEIVKNLLSQIYENGDIYKAKYEGYYCIGCEKFLTETEMVDNHCPIHPPEKTVWQSEENWFFKLSKYVPRLIGLIESNDTNYVFPEGKRQEVLAKLKAGVKDVSISRANITWGIPLPWDPKQVTYVWFDALINYYSATQFLENKLEFWPASIHLLGKEILWFHTVIWQAMLLAANLPLPCKTYTHSFYMIDGQKMSKSLGNVISPGQLVEIFGIDGARYLVTRSFPSHNDADVGIERFKEKYNADLANNLGNLVSRVAKLGQGLELTGEIENYDPGVGELLDKFQLNEAIELIFDKWVNPSNNLLNQETPWKLEVTDPKRTEVIKSVAINLLKAAWHLKPVIPQAAETIITCLSGTITPLQKPLFPRI
jgi:methionyl-tRNA synthetase